MYTVKNGVLINTLNFIGECQCVLMSTPVFTNTRSGLTEHTNWVVCNVTHTLHVKEHTDTLGPTVIHTHYAFYTTVQAKQPRDYVTIIKLIIDNNKYPRNKLLWMTIKQKHIKGFKLL